MQERSSSTNLYVVKISKLLADQGVHLKQKLSPFFVINISLFVFNQKGVLFLLFSLAKGEVPLMIKVKDRQSFSVL